MQASSGAHYQTPSDFLEQGDIFRQEVVIPSVDTDKRIFRTEDGRHGSVVFSEGVAGQVFDNEELVELLQRTPRSPLHTDPFKRTTDGHYELVIASAKLSSYFIVATQTCDVSGVDRDAHPTAIILPVITVIELCRSPELPFKSMDGQIIAIESFLEQNCGATGLAAETDAFIYPEKIKKVLREWEPKTKATVEDRNRIKNFLNRMAKTGFVYQLPSDSTFRIPESYVDLSAAFTVFTSRLRALSSLRLARLANPYREEFAQAFGNRIARVAVPAPEKTEGY